jgi:hypothetical protein
LLQPLQEALDKLAKSEDEFKALYILSKMRARLLAYNATHVKPEASSSNQARGGGKVDQLKQTLKHVASSSQRKTLSAVEQGISDIDVLTTRILRGHEEINPIEEVRSLAEKHTGSRSLDKENTDIKL